MKNIHAIIFEIRKKKTNVCGNISIIKSLRISSFRFSSSRQILRSYFLLFFTFTIAIENFYKYYLRNLFCFYLFKEAKTYDATQNIKRLQSYIEDDCDDVIILNLKINDCFFSFLWLFSFFFNNTATYNFT
jgi:hypothetical protein